jgi:hypothetical protein
MIDAGAEVQMRTFLLVTALMVLTVALALGFVLPAAAGTAGAEPPAGGITAPALVLIVGICVVAWELVRVRF